MENHSLIKISLFSRMVINYNNHEIIISEYLGKQLLILLEMLVYYHQNAFSNEIIMKAIWSQRKNPQNAMKYTIYRLRTKLKTIPGLEDLELIVTGSNCYVLNPAYTYQIDCEEFLSLHQTLKNKDWNEEQANTAMRLMMLYQGRIYQSSRIPWAININNYCQRIYKYHVEELMKYYTRQKQYLRVIEITQHSVVMIPDFEKAYYYHFDALINLQRFQEAREYYDITIQKFKDHYEMTMNNEFRQLFHQLMLHNRNTKWIDDIYGDLMNREHNENAFYCEYDVFQYIFEKALRDQTRYHFSFYLIMFSLESFPENQEIKIMQKLKRIISRTIRTSDSFTRINELQFIALISCESEGDVHTIAQRVIQKFYRATPGGGIRLGYSIKRISSTQ